MNLTVCWMRRFDFESKVYFALAYPLVLAAASSIVAIVLAKSVSSFEGLRGTCWMFATVGIYTFGPFARLFTVVFTCAVDGDDCYSTGASIISTTFVVFPCFQGVDEQMMVHNLLSVYL